MPTATLPVSSIPSVAVKVTVKLSPSTATKSVSVPLVGVKSVMSKSVTSSLNSKVTFELGVLSLSWVSTTSTVTVGFSVSTAVPEEMPVSANMALPAASAPSDTSTVTSATVLPASATV